MRGLVRADRNSALFTTINKSWCVLFGYIGRIAVLLQDFLGKIIEDGKSVYSPGVGVLPHQQLLRQGQSLEVSLYERLCQVQT